MNSRITTELDGDVATVRIDRPKKCNAMTISMWEQLTEHLTAAVEDGARAIVLTGTGEYFCAGDDISALVEVDDGRDARRLAETLLTCWRTIETAPIPVIGRANGSAYGGGFETLLAADISIVPTDARLQLSEVRIGAFPFYAAKRLVHITGKQRAMDLAVGGRTINGRTAANWGAVARAVPHADLDDAVADVLDQVRSGSPEALMTTKRWLNATLQTPGEDIGMLTGLGHLFAGSDAPEGAQAFLEDRPPQFRGP